MELFGITKNAHKKYVCDVCDYSCCYRRDWNRHIFSAKHKNWANGINLELKCPKMPKNAQLEKKLFICNCGKEYETQSGLWKHKKKCYDDKNILIKQTDNKIVFDKDIMMTLIQQNSELLEIIKNGTNQTINNTVYSNNINSNNKTFNLQVFLNETCKNAMNLSEFIENMTVELPDLENMGKLGYVEGVSNIIIKNLKALEITQRPIHCTDEKRETVMIKDNNVWFKEGDDRENLRKIVSTVISRNLVLLSEYQEKYPDCNTYDSHRSDEYTKIIMETATNQVEKKKEKIFRLIAREVVIDKNNIY
jgi:hypothetical protein